VSTYLCVYVYMPVEFDNLHECAYGGFYGKVQREYLCVCMYV
jgi:hypothetical protein